VPAIAEAGVPGYDATVWLGLLAPAGTPREVVQKINAEIAKVLSAAEAKRLMASAGVDVSIAPPPHARKRPGKAVALLDEGVMTATADCVFCKIRDDQIPSAKIYEDAATLVFMDINPLNAGHCLVVTKRHAATIWEADIADLQAAIATAKKVATALRAALKPDGLNMLQANGAAAFQSVPHFHLHLIPRWTGDGKGFDWKVVPGDREQITKVADRVRAALGDVR
jgi:histidine triad (HIT) family protein